jgi:large subunit ribosomal protein L9
MKVILISTVPNLGEPGKIVEVAPGYARNYLLPRKLAVIADEGNQRQLQHHMREAQRRLEKMATDARGLAQRIGEITLVIKAKGGEAGRLYGSVTSADVADYLSRDHGMEVDKRRIEIPDPIKSLGEHVVNVKLPGDVRTQLRVMVEPLPAAEVAEIAEEAPAEEASEAPAADAETGPSD